MEKKRLSKKEKEEMDALIQSRKKSIKYCSQAR
jgi:hypothetical protein